MIKITKGNIFNSTCDCLVNPTNSIGVMGKGLAKQFMNKYNEICITYNQESKDTQRFQEVEGQYNEIKLLPPSVFESLLWGIDKTIIMFPTKKHWRHPSKIEYISKNMDNLVEKIYKYNLNSIAFPMLGCGYGNLTKQQVLPIMNKYLENFDNSYYFEIYDN